MLQAMMRCDFQGFRGPNPHLSVTLDPASAIWFSGLGIKAGGIRTCGKSAS